MYATTNLPGSSCFDYFGPATKADCEAWLKLQKDEYQRDCGGLWFNAYASAEISSNKEAESWRYRDGSHVINGPSLTLTEYLERDRELLERTRRDLEDAIR